MSIIKGVQPVAQHDQRHGVEKPDSRDNQKLSRWADLSVLGAASMIGLGGLTLIAWLLLPLSSNIVRFVAATALPLFTLFVVFYQALVYRRQWNAMLDALEQTDKVIGKMQDQWEIMNEQLQLERAKTYPRLQITNVRVVNLKPDEGPIFMISIKNVGALDATETEIDLRVSFGRPVESTLAQKLSNPQIVTIPAGQEHTYAIPWDGPIKQEHLDRLHKVPLTVSGFIKPKGEDEQTFCYRYYPIKGERPQGMPEFVPCDFDTRLTRVVTPGTAGVKVTAHAPIVVQGEVIPSKPEDKTDTETKASPN